MKIPKRLRKNSIGAIEGLPLQLLIMIIIAGIVIVIILAWLAPWQNKVDLDSLTVTPNSVDNDTDSVITITAWDTKGNKLQGVSIIVSGCNVGNLVNTTGADGTCTFTVHPEIPPGTTNDIQILGKFTGIILTEKTAFVVVS